MKTKILSMLTLVVAAIGLGACSEDWQPKLEKTGTLSLSSMGIAVQGEETVARAEYDLNNFIVNIFQSGETKNVVASWKYSELPEIFTLPVGKYRVDVVSHQVKPAEWSAPLYKGSAEFEIKNGEITSVGNIVCRFASLRVSVKFSDNLIAAAGSDLQVEVVAGESGSLIFTTAESRSGYFEVVDGSTTLAAYFKGTVKGYYEDLHKVYTDVKPGQHRIITFTLKGEVIDPSIESGVIDVTNGINISAVMSQDALDGNIDISEDATNPDRPGQEDFKDSFAMNYAPADGSVSVKTPEELTSLILNVNTDNTDAATEFAAINGVDLLNPGAASSALAKYDITVSQSRSATYIIGLSGLVAAAKEYEGNHSFDLTAVNASGASVNTTVAVKGKGGAEGAITFDTDLDFEGINGVDVDKAVVVIGAEAGIAHLNVVISSSNSDFIASAGELLPLEFDLATVSGDTADNLSSIGLPVGSEVAGKTSVDFNITDLVPLLAAFPGTHKFSIAVEDAAGNTDSRTLTFVAQ